MQDLLAELRKLVESAPTEHSPPEAREAWRVAAEAVALAARERERAERAERLNRREMRDVARIQRLLLPGEDVRLRGLDVAARLDTFGLAGGDYYDYMALTHRVRDPATVEQDIAGVMVADVTGHGAAAAVEAAMFDAILRTYEGDPRRGADGVLDFANRHFFSRLGRSNFITAVAATIDPEAATLRYANAGHPPPLLRRHAERGPGRSGGSVEWLTGGEGIPIGVLPEAEYTAATCAFEPHDALVLYTDGVLEAADPDGEEFGAERLADVVQEAPNSAEEILQAIRSAVAEHQRGAPARDDRTLVVLRRQRR